MTIRWGLIGVGDIANKRVVAGIQGDKNSQLVAMCRRNAAELNRFADQFSVPGRFTDANQLIAMSDLDAVYIATPVACHAPQTIAAARAGKHVLVEKPMALDPDQCAQMIDVCEREKVLLGVAYYRRFYPVVARIRQLIDAGQLGRVLSVACVTGNSSRFPADDWRVVRSQGGGGPLMDIGSHRLDLFMHLLGEVDSVKTNLIESTDYEAEQVAMMLLEFKAGCVGVLQCYFGAADTPDRLEIIGTEGRITMEHLNAGEFMLFNSNGCTLERHPPASNLHAPLIADFSAAIIEGRSPAVDGRIGKQTNDVIQMAYDAAGRIT